MLCAGTALAADAVRAPEHPSLFFSADDLDALKTACQGPMKAQFEALVAYADEHFDDIPPVLQGDYEERGLAVEHPYLTNILDFSFLYLITGEAKYLDAARRWSFALAAMPKWAGPVNDECPEADRGLYAGFGLTALACAYDWLYADLSDVERALIRNKLYTVAERIFRATDGGEWWSKAYLHHDHTIPVGGMGLAAMALYDEFEEARKWAARAESEFACTFERLGSDGAWHEGTCGWAFAMASLCPFWDAYSRRAAPAWEKNAWLENTWAFRLYSRLPDGQFFNFGDGRADGHYQWTAWQAAPTLRLLAKKFENPHAQWLAAREWDKRPNPYTAVWEIIWADPSIAEASPASLDLVKAFDNQGLSFLRTGWDAADTALAFRCDSLVGKTAAEFYDKGEDEMRTAVDHTHADAGAAALWSGGAFHLANAAYGQRTTEFQNSLLIDGEGQYRRLDRERHPGRPRGLLLRTFSSPFAGLVEGDATLSYSEAVEKFTRTAYLVGPGIVFLLDEVKTREPSQLEWRFHVRKGAQIDLGPSNFSTSDADSACSFLLAGAVPLALEAGENERNSRVTVATDGEVAEVSLLSAIVPLSTVMGPFSGQIGESAFTMELEGLEIIASCSTGAPPGDPSKKSRLELEGTFAAIALNDKWKGFVADQAVHVRLDGEEILESNNPVTAALTAQGELAFLYVDCDRPARLAVNAFGHVRGVRGEDGREVQIGSKGSLVTLYVPAGKSRYQLNIASRQAD